LLFVGLLNVCSESKIKAAVEAYLYGGFTLIYSIHLKVLMTFT